MNVEESNLGTSQVKAIGHMVILQRIIMVQFVLLIAFIHSLDLKKLIFPFSL